MIVHRSIQKLYFQSTFHRLNRSMGCTMSSAGINQYIISTHVYRVGFGLGPLAEVSL